MWPTPLEARYAADAQPIPPAPIISTVPAAIRRLADDVSGKRVGAILSGGNTDFAWLAPG